MQSKYVQGFAEHDFALFIPFSALSNLPLYLFDLFMIRAQV